MPDSTPDLDRGAATGLDHVGIMTADLDTLARSFSEAGFHLTPYAAHASGRTGNRCVMLRDGSYLELIAAAPGQVSTTLDRFLAIGPGAHILALEVKDELAARDRSRRAGIAVGDVSITERHTESGKARFALLLPPDLPEGRALLIRHLTREMLWRPENTTHLNHAVALAETVFAAASPALTMARLSRLSGRAAEPDPLGGYRIPLARGCIRILPRDAAATLFPSMPDGLSLVGLTIAVQSPPEVAQAATMHVGGIAIRFVPKTP